MNHFLRRKKLNGPCHQVWHSLTLLVMMSCINGIALADSNEDRIIHYTAVERIYTENCAYIGETALEIHYELWSADVNDLVITGTGPDAFTSELLRQEVQGGRGSVTVFFHAEGCLQSIDIHLE